MTVTKDLVRGFIRWLIIVLLVLNALVYFGVASAKCQKLDNPLHLSQHSDNMEQEDEGGWAFITVTEKVGDLVYFYREGKKGVHLTSMGWDKHSSLKDETKEQFRGCYFMLYCKKHLYIYYLQRFPCQDLKGPFRIVPK